MRKILLLIAVSIAFLTACKKQELVENTAYEKLSQGDPKYSYLKILNLTPGSPTLTYYMDGLKFSSSLSSLGIENAGYSYNGLFPDFGYAITSPGSHKLTAKIIPTATLDAGLEVLNTTINPQAGKYYSLFTTGQYSATSKNIPSVLTIEDIKPALDTSKVFVRLVNLAIGAPNLDLVKGDLSSGPKNISNIAYGTSSSGWVELPSPGVGVTPVIKLWLNNSATGVPLSATALSASLSKGRAYTIYTRGVVGSTATPFTATFYTTFF